jgi:hypothetical protein
VSKLCVDHVWANAIVVLIPLANLGFHPGLDRRHGLDQGLGDHFFDDLVLIDSQI